MELAITRIDQLRPQLTEAFEKVANESKAMACAISGGATAMLFLGALKDAVVDWSRIRLFWTDERAVPPDDPESNFGVVERMLLAPLGPRAPQAWRMPADHHDLRAAAMAYEAALVQELSGAPLDLVILGIGEDGHVASLFPGHRALTEKTGRVLAIEDSPKPPSRRLTLSLPYIVASRHVWVVAVGVRKRAVLQAAVTRQHRNTPLDLVLAQARNVTVFTDQIIQHR